MIKIGTVINYCTLEYKFIKHCVVSVKPFSSQIVMVAADHFFDGTTENRELLNKTYSEVQDVEIIEYKWEENLPRYWHNMSRWIGLQTLRDDIEFVLFLDADEIIDNNFLKWLVLANEEFLNEGDGFLFYCYWYFREAKFRAKTLETAGLLVKKEKLTKENMFTEQERHGIFNCLQNVAFIYYVDGAPMVHHYSWVRTKDEMLKKIKSWGHRNDTDWQKIIEEEFTHEFNGTDFLPGHHYQYDIITPIHDIKL